MQIKRFLVAALCGSLLFGLVGCGAGSQPPADQPQNTETVQTDTQPPEDIGAGESLETTPAEPTQTLTMGQKNVLAAADDYLSIMSFSRSGLIEQLEYEGYTTDEATYAADNCNADWNEQATKSAQNYLDMTSFSRQGLIEQLMFEGFTQEQAEYGAGKVGY